MSTKLKSAEAPEEAAEGGKSKKKLLIIVGAVLLVAVTAGVCFFLFRGSGEPEAEKKPEPGLVIPLENSLTINLADGHFLKVGLALQATIEVKEELDGSKARDITIDLLSNKKVDELSTDKGRQAVKKELVEKIGEAYEHEVMDIYFTEFVMS